MKTGMPDLQSQLVDADIEKTKGRPRRKVSRGRSYTIYLTPEEHNLLSYMGRELAGGKGVSEGIRYLIKYFSTHTNGGTAL